VLGNLFFHALHAIQGWIANFDELELCENVRSGRIHFWLIVVEKSQDGFFQHPAIGAIFFGPKVIAWTREVLMLR